MDIPFIYKKYAEPYRFRPVPTPVICFSCLININRNEYVVLATLKDPCEGCKHSMVRNVSCLRLRGIHNNTTPICNQYFTPHFRAVM